MKKLHLLIPLLVIACKKELQIPAEKITEENSSDTISVILKTEKEDNLNIISVDGSKMPIRLNLEITNPEEHTVVKIENLDQSEIYAFIKPEHPMNLRFNQIRKPDNTFDGPFDQTLIYETPEKGEYWLILSKNNMMDGDEPTLGKFFLKVE